MAKHRDLDAPFVRSFLGVPVPPDSDGPLWDDTTARDYRRQHGHWVPAVGDVVCVHANVSIAAFHYLAVVLEINGRRVGSRVRVAPLPGPRTNDRDYSMSALEETVVTFSGPICIRCKTGRIR